MKKFILLGLLSILIITGLFATISCGTSSSTTSPSIPGGAQTSSPPGQTPGPDFQPGKTADISMQGLAFVPAAITVAAGTTITWTNNDFTIHTVTSDTGAFASQDIAMSGTFSHTFGEKGVFPYHCTIHPTMKGTVTVE